MIEVSNAVRAALPYELKLVRLRCGGTTYLPEVARYVASACGGDAISIGSVCAASLTAEITGTLYLADQLITAEVEIAGETVPLGTFTVTECVNTGTKTRLTAYDAAYYALGVDYTPASSPTTALGVLGDICAQTGLTLDYGGSDVPISGDLIGHTMREMVGYMAALLGCNAVIGRDGALRLIWFSDNGQRITPDDYYSGGLSLEGETTLAGVQMTKTVKVQTAGEDGTVTEEDVTSVYDAGEGSGTVIAVDNPFATQAIVDAVWAKIRGLGTYRAGSCAIFGGLLTEPGDIVTITDIEGVTSTVPVMSVTLELDGGCKCTVTASGQSQTEADAKVLGPTGKALSKLAADLGEFKELTADNFTATMARIANLFVNDLTLSNLLHSEDYLRTGDTYADAGLGIDFASKIIAATNFYIKNGMLYAKGGQIAGFKLASGQSVSYWIAPSSYLDTGGSAASYSYDSPNLTADVDGTAIYSAAKTETPSGTSYVLSRLWVHAESGGEDEERLAGRILYLDSGGNALYVSSFDGLRYYPSTSALGRTFTLNADYLAVSASVRLEIDLAAGDKVRVQRWYGLWSSLYYGNSSKMMGDPDGVYLGTDGISVGEDICLTPDGHATVDELTVRDNLEIKGAFYGRGTAALSQWLKVAGRIYGAGRVFSNGKTAIADAADGCLLDDGVIVLARETNPAIDFYRGGATSVTSTIRETSDGTLTVRDNFEIKGAFYGRGTAALSQWLKVAGWIYGAGRVFSNGKTAIADAADGCLLDDGVIVLARGTSPGIDFYRGGATSATSRISETANGTLTVRDNFAVGGTLTQGGLAVPKIRHGRVTVSGVTSTPTAFSVTFPAAFAGQPEVLLTPIRDSGMTLHAKLRTVSASGFTGDAWYDGSGSATSVTIHWMAVYG